MKKYLWVDVETTGLFVNRLAPYILEIAAVITDKNYSELGPSYRAIMAPALDYRQMMNDYVVDMHTKSGLLDELDFAGQFLRTPDEIDREMVQWMRENDVLRQNPRERAVLAGSSVHFDRAVMEAWLPGVVDNLHYRNLDVSSLKEFIKDQFPDIARTWQVQMEGEDNAHRALADIRMSLSELRFYAERLGSKTVTY